MVTSGVTALGYELVGIEQLSQGRHSLLRIYIDSERGITLDDCEKVGRQLGAILEVEDPIRGQYNLEVSSPGLDRPLYTAAHFERFIGQQVKLRLHRPVDGQRKFKGTIAGVDGTRIQIALEGDRVLELELEEIEHANLIPVF
ncbi:MAG: ribosome maturation factor RimP [Gammaproteobacteria bacterium]|nr:ribosome maturation factor RimP [Gammaproteobacteria bacterium]